MSLRGNGGLIGKRRTASDFNAIGVWNLRDQYFLKTSTPDLKWPLLVQGGERYATQYINITGGNIIIHDNTVTDIRSTLATLNKGDALLIPPGSYTSGTFIWSDSGLAGTTIFNQPYLVCGLTENPNDVIIEVDNDSPDARRDHPVFSNRFPADNDYQQIAYLTYKRIQTSGTSYENSLLRPYTEEGSDWGGSAFKVYFDINGGDVSWMYDPSSPDYVGTVYWRNCTFANYNNWDARFNGRADVNRLTECVFQSTYQTADAVSIGNNYTNVTITDQTYDLETYPAGHLYETFSAPFSTF